VLEALQNKISGLLRGKWERFIIIERVHNVLDVTEAKVNSRDKEIRILKSYTVEDFGLLKKPFRLVDKLILALDSHSATTVESVIRLKRPEPQEPINEGELDTLVFKGLWKFLNRYRSWAAKKMGVTDLDLVLANAEIRDVALGSYKVFNPLGFKGSDLFLRFRGTLIPRSLLRQVEKLRSWARDFILIENGSIISLSVPEPAAYVIHTGRVKTSAFILGENECIYYKDILWGTDRVRDRLARMFSVDTSVATLILDRHISGQVSDKLNRAIAAELKQEFQNLFDLTAAACKGFGISKRQTAYFHFRFPAHFLESLFKKRYVRLIHFRKSLERRGYSVIMKHAREPSKTHDSVLTFLIHNYSYPQYQFLNQLLKRRAKWLIPHS